MFLEYSKNVASIVLDDEATRNALSFSTFHELGCLIDEAEARQDIRVLIIRGENGVFSSGGDLAELSRGIGPNYVVDYWQRMQRTILKLRSIPQVVIAAVNGPALGAGAALMLAADIALISRRARFRWNFGSIGYVPDAGTALLLTQCLGVARARDLLLSGRWMEADEAISSGLVARLAETEDFDAALASLVSEIRANPPHALALTKTMIDSVALPTFQATVRNDGIYQLAATVAGDFRQRLASHAGNEPQNLEQPFQRDD